MFTKNFQLLGYMLAWSLMLATGVGLIFGWDKESTILGRQADVVGVVIIGIAIIPLFLYVVDFWSTPIEAVGKLEKKISASDDSFEGSLIVAHRMLTARQELIEGLTLGQSYRITFSPRTKHVLTIERVDAEL